MNLWTVLAFVVAAALVSSGVFLLSVPLGLIVTGLLVALLTVLMVADFGDTLEAPRTTHRD